MAGLKHRAQPRVIWTAVLSGFVLSVVITLAGALLGDPTVASAIGVAGGGYLAGRLARSGGLLQGAVVGVLWVLAEALGPDLFVSGATSLAVDTAATVIRDAVLLALGVAGGWLATRS